MNLVSKFPFYIVMLMVAGISVFYTNCSQSEWQASKTSEDILEVTVQPLEKLQDGLLNQYGPQITASLCQDSQRYHCDLRSYRTSTRTPNSTTDSSSSTGSTTESSTVSLSMETQKITPATYPCVNLEGHDICPSGLDIVLDASELAASCEDSSCLLDPREASDYFCYLNLPNIKGNFPIQGHFENLEKGVAKIHADCLNLVEKANSGG